MTIADVQFDNIGVAVSTLFADPVTISPTGYDLAETWTPVAGATGARVESATLRVHPESTGWPRSIGVLVGARDNVTEIAIDVGRADLPLRGVHIPNLERVVDGADPAPVVPDSDNRLIVMPTVNGQQQAPILAVPALGGNNQLPDQLTGAGWSGSFLSLPDIVGRRFTIRLVAGNRPDEMTAHTFNHGDVTVYTSPAPVGLHVLDASGTEAYTLAGGLRQNLDYDLTAATNRYVASAAGSGDPVSVGVSLRSDVAGTARVSWNLSGTTIERTIEGRLTAEAEGAATAIAVPPPHPGRAPRHTIADVTITHQGIALHPISDAVPTTDADLGGVLVTDTAVHRRLPPEALRHQVLRRVAVIGWPHGSTDLTLTVADRATTVSGLAPQAGRAAPRVVWFDVGEITVEAALDIGLVATRGAFAWVAQPEPLVQLAISSGPDGEGVRVGGVTIALTGAETVVGSCKLAGTDRWDIETDQFCEVSVASAVMEFAP